MVIPDKHKCYKMKNCLQHSLELWNNQRTLKLWYNSNHVVIIEPEFDLKVFGYLELKEYGFNHFLSSFNLTAKYKKLLKSYLK